MYVNIFELKRVTDANETTQTTANVNENLLKRN